MTMLGYIQMLLAFLIIVFLWVWWGNRSSILTNWPVFGMVPQLLWNTSHIHDFLSSILQKSGGTIMFKGPWFCGFNYLLLSDPLNIHYILSKNFTNYQKGPEFKEIFEPLGDGIFNSDSDSWKIQRRIIHSLFNDDRFQLAVRKRIEQKILKGLFLVLENASKLGNEVNIQDVFQRFMFDNTCQLVLGFDPNSLSTDLPEVPVKKAFDDMEEVVLYRHVSPTIIWKLQRWLQIGKEKKFKKAWDIVNDYAQQCITSKREQLSQSRNQMEGEDFDLLTYFLAVDGDNDKEGDQSGIDIKSNKFLVDITINLLAAGVDTIAAALVWLIWIIATHPIIEEKILEEIKENLKVDKFEEQRIFSFEEVRELTYLHAVVCEVLRLYPSVPFNHIVSIKPDVLPSGHHIPQNMSILYSLYSVGRMKKIWGEDCLEFKPERWISNQGKIKHVPSYKFIAFNSGPRSCLGKDLSFMELKAIASTIVWNYSLQVVENHPISPKVSVILYMKKGLKVRISKRFAS